jgi:hypothetical protein
VSLCGLNNFAMRLRQQSSQKAKASDSDEALGYARGFVTTRTNAARVSLESAKRESPAIVS